MIRLKNILDTTEYDALYEGLIKSHPKVSVIRFLEKQTNKKVFINNIHKNGQGFLFAIHDAEMSVKKFEEILKTIENGYGWKPILFIYNFDDEYTEFERMFLDEGEIPMVRVQLEPMHPVQLTTKQYPIILFHISPTKFKDKILKKGLIPKSINKKFKHKDRVYFTDNFTIIKSLTRALSRANNEREWSVYRIRTIHLPSNFTLFSDELLDNSFFTKDNVSSRIITHIEDFEI